MIGKPAERFEARLMTSGGALLLILAALFALFPRVLVYSLCMMFVWLGVALLYRSSPLHRAGSETRVDDSGMGCALATR